MGAHAACFCSSSRGRGLTCRQRKTSCRSTRLKSRERTVGWLAILSDALAWMDSDWPTRSCGCRFRMLYVRLPGLYAVGHPRRARIARATGNVPSALWMTHERARQAWRADGWKRACAVARDVRARRISHVYLRRRDVGGEGALDAAGRARWGRREGSEVAVAARFEP
jgi:hypothetical protein